MRPVNLSPISPAASIDEKLNWCIAGLQQIARHSHLDDPNHVADGMTLTNQSDSRSLDCTGATLGQLLLVMGTLINDMKKRGAKRT